MRVVPSIGSASLRRFWEGFVGDLPRFLAVGGLLVGTAVVCRHPRVLGWPELDQVVIVLALISVACGVLAAAGCAMMGQLSDDARGMWLACAITLYSVIAIPAATIGSTGTGTDAAAIGNVRLFSHFLFVVLIVVAVSATTSAPWDRWSVVLGGLLLVALVAGLGEMFPQASLAVTTNQAVRYPLAVAWILASFCLIPVSWWRRESWLSWAGLGCTVIAVAHGIRVTAGDPSVALGLTFSMVRLLGVLLLLVGVAGPARRALRQVLAQRSLHQEEQRLALVDRRERELRDHDVRNSLAGLAGVTVLLEDAARNEDERAALREAVGAELARIEVLLRPADPPGIPASLSGYDVRTVLRQQAALQRGLHMDITVDAEPGLRTNGSPSTLSQVMNNLLVNCAQHATGSPVRVRAGRRAGKIEIEVSDLGPGIPPDSEDAMFDLGCRGSASTGQGLGLHSCRRLIEACSGSIRIRPQSEARPGCTVVIELPAADGEHSGESRAARARQDVTL